MTDRATRLAARLAPPTRWDDTHRPRTVRMSDELWDRLDATVARTGRSKVQLVAEALTQYLDTLDTLDAPDRGPSTVHRVRSTPGPDAVPLGPRRGHQPKTPDEAS